MPSTWCHCIKMSLKCLHSRSSSYSHQYLVSWSQCKGFISYGQWSRGAVINTCDMLTFKEPHKPASFQTKFDFIAWLQEEHISKVLASEATHRPAMLSSILSQYCSVSKWEAKPSSLLSLGKRLTLTVLQFYLKWQNVFLPLPSLFFTGEKKTFQPTQ